MCLLISLETLTFYLRTSCGATDARMGEGKGREGEECETRLNKQTCGYPEMILLQTQKTETSTYKDTNADTDTCY